MKDLAETELINNHKTKCYNILQYEKKLNGGKQRKQRRKIYDDEETKQGLQLTFQQFFP